MSKVFMKTIVKLSNLGYTATSPLWGNLSWLEWHSPKLTLCFKFEVETTTVQTLITSCKLTWPPCLPLISTCYIPTLKFLAFPYMKGKPNVRGHSRSLEKAYMTFYNHYDHTLYPTRHDAILLKIANFTHPTCIRCLRWRECNGMSTHQDLACVLHRESICCHIHGIGCVSLMVLTQLHHVTIRTSDRNHSRALSTALLC